MDYYHWDRLAQLGNKKLLIECYVLRNESFIKLDRLNGGSELDVKFVDLYDAYFDDIYRYVYVKTSNKWDTEDLVSDVFRKAFEKFSMLEGHPNDKAWLFTIARNTVIDYYRKKKSVLMGVEFEQYLSQLQFEDPFDGTTEKECLQKSLRHLSDEDLEITELRYFADLKFKDMAVILKKEEGSLRVKSNRITKKLGVLVRKCWGDYDGERKNNEDTLRVKK